MKKDKFLLNIQKEKMKELWDNNKDDSWNNVSNEKKQLVRNELLKRIN